MRTFVLSVITTLFVTPAFAEEMKCTVEPIPASNQFIASATEQYPDLSKGEAVDIAHAVHAAWINQQLAKDEERSEADRAFAVRAEKLMMRIAAVQLNSFRAMPEMQSVLERMEAEEAAGLERVSAELEPDVRHMAHTMLAIGRQWSSISTDVTKLSSDRFLAIADSGNITAAMEVADRTLCTIEATMDVMDHVVALLPGALILATVERLNY